MPNQTVCADGKVQSCDAAGNVVSSQTCSLGCFENQPRCRDIDPSNGLASYLDMVSSPRDLDLSPGGTIEVEQGGVSIPGMAVPVDTFLIPATANAPAVRVIVANKVTLGGNIDVVPDFRGTGPALAIVAAGEIRFTGNVYLGAVGTMDAPGCTGGTGAQQRSPGTPVKQLASGSGGGGNATAGARGGGIDTQLAGGAGGSITGTKALVPLRGGCAAGNVNGEGGAALSEAYGGGAIQLSSRIRIVVDGVINASGAPGSTVPTLNGGWVIFGGGAGGGILLEAPVVSLGPNAKLLTTGGPGGGVCASSSTYCGAGGAGATVNTAAQPGGDSLYQTTGAATSYGGGGGGGLGRIRVNTPNAAYTKSSGSVEDGDVSTGTLGTR